jgi:hypothetical protein
MLSRLYEDLGFASSPPSAVTTRLGNALNEAHRAVLREPALSRLRDTATPISFASEADRVMYGLPSQLMRVTVITERTNDRELSALSLQELREHDPGLTSTGTPWAFVPLGYGPISRLPAATGIWAASASASDTTQTVQINGVRSGGLSTGDLTATLTGTTRAAIGTVTDIVDLQVVSLSAVGVGVVSLYDASSSGNVIAEIPIGQTAPQYFRVQLYPTPDAAITYYVDGTYRIPTLDDAQDVPMLPDDFHDMLMDYARWREYERTSDTERAMLARSDWTTALSRLKHSVSAMAADMPVMGRMNRPRYSRFGAWTPAE